jgi:hypothetical protein
MDELRKVESFESHSYNPTNTTNVVVQPIDTSIRYNGHTDPREYVLYPDRLASQQQFDHFKGCKLWLNKLPIS